MKNVVNSELKGVDIDLGNNCSNVAFNWAKKTFEFRSGLQGSPQESDENGFFAQIIQFGNMRIAISSDGIGTKAEIAERTGIYDTLGYDLMAMVVDDISAIGAIPTTISNILDVDYPDASIVSDLMKGLYSAAEDANVVISGGEIAELAARVKGWGKKMHFNWSATGIGYVPEKKDLIDGSGIASGQMVVSLYSPGFRSNGFTLARTILLNKYGEDWHNVFFKNDMNWGRALLTPSLIYSPFISDILSKNLDIKGIAHITGGGIIENFSRTLKRNGFGAVLYNLFEPDDFVCELQSIGKIHENVAYRQWNMGNGLLVVAWKNDVEKILSIAETIGIKAKICGEISESHQIEIHTRGANPQVIKGEIR